jgi:small subunit ribosomal protein S8
VVLRYLLKSSKLKAFKNGRAVDEKIDNRNLPKFWVRELCCLKQKEFSNMVNDTISDMLTRIRNANIARKPSVSILKTKVHERICQILEREGFIEKYYVSDTQPNELVIDLKYQSNRSVGFGSQGKPCITNLKRISTPGLRVYTNSKEIPKVLGGMGILIVSTSKGLMTDRQARQARLGGEILCSVW